jgi:hypothetical protein
MKNYSLKLYEVRLEGDCSWTELDGVGGVEGVDELDDRVVEDSVEVFEVVDGLDVETSSVSGQMYSKHEYSNVERITENNLNGYSIMQLTLFY